VGKKSRGPSRRRPCLSLVCRRPALAAAGQLQRTGELVVGGGAAARVARRGRRGAWVKLHLNQWKPKIEYIWYISFLMYLDITYVYIHNNIYHVIATYNLEMREYFLSRSFRACLANRSSSSMKSIHILKLESFQK
jgi:hypothetical protein